MSYEFDNDDELQMVKILQTAIDDITNPEQGLLRRLKDHASDAQFDNGDLVRDLLGAVGEITYLRNRVSDLTAQCARYEQAVRNVK
tara:strand:- start:1745 stop:2002 length:258 start_codon:yes stop_codon:yes gene_type:complete